MLLSILVPTKNNTVCMESAVHGFIALANLTKNTELVIVDNSDKENDYLKSISNEHIVYDWSSASLDMLANFNRAITLAKGKYVCMLGDDDFVLPSIFEVAKLLDKNSIDCAMADLSPYYWPQVNTHWIRNNVNGFLEVPKRKLKPVTYDVSKGLKKILDTGGSQYINILPSAYHGMVRKSVLDTLLVKYGTAFPGPSPDISNAILLALQGVSCYKVTPFVVSGAASGSAAAEGASHAHHGELDERAGFIKRGDVSWPQNVPQFFCGPTMWSVSVIHTLNYTNNGHLTGMLNANYLHAACFAYHRQYSSKILKSLNEQKNCSLIGFAICFISVGLQRVKQYISNWFKYNKYLSFLSGWKVVQNVIDTSEVAKYVDK